MKKFIFSILSVSVFFVGIGGLINQVGAKFKSDERALEIIAQARQAIGGDAAIKTVKSLTIVGNTTHSFTIDGATKTEQGSVEINLQLPNHFSKTLKLGQENAGGEGENIVEKDVKILVREANGETADLRPDASDGSNKRVVRIIKGDAANTEELKEGVSADGHKVFVNKDVRFTEGAHRQNELFRTTFALLLSAPEGSDVSYTFVGEGSVDGSSCDIVQAQMSGDSAFKIYIDKSSHLPLMLTYQGMKPMMFRFEKGAAKTEAGTDVRVISRRSDTATSELQEFQIKFSDYRSVGDVRLPYKWTQTVGGQVDQTTDIVSYVINPANIADKFTPARQRVLLRSDKQK